jgi:hypothetical protein
MCLQACEKANRILIVQGSRPAIFGLNLRVYRTDQAEIPSTVLLNVSSSFETTRGVCLGEGFSRLLAEVPKVYKILIFLQGGVCKRLLVLPQGKMVMPQGRNGNATGSS